MRYVIFILLSLLSMGVSAQMVTQPGTRDYQITGGTLPDSILYIMGTDTVDGSSKQGLAKWYRYDSIIGAANSDHDFYGLGTGSAPLIGEDSIETADTMYVLFHGLSGGLHTKIEMLKDGILQFDKGGRTSNYDDYFIKFKPFDEDNTVNFNFTNHTEEFAGGTIESFGIGWNQGPAGASEVGGRSLLGTLWEYNYWEPSTGRLVDEWHLLHTDTTGYQRRPITTYMDVGNTFYWGIGFAFTSFEVRSPDTVSAFVKHYLDNANSRVTTYINNPYTATGVQFDMDEDDNFYSIGANGLTGANMLFQNFDSTIVNSKLSYAVNAGTPTKVTGRDAGGYFSDFDWQPLADSIALYDPDNWTDSGGTLHPTGNEEVHIPSILGSSTGKLNLIGRFDQAFPTSSYNNIVIGEGAGNASLAADDNVYIGTLSGVSNTAGYYNVFIGRDAGSLNTASSNVGVGHLALSTNTSGTGLVAIGDRALMDATGNNNVGIGAEAGTNIAAGSGNLAIGTSALYSVASGGNNIGIGRQTGNNTQTGQRNVFIGALAGYGNGAANNANSDNVLIGEQSGYNLAGSGNIFLGWASGYNETGSNQLYIENSTSSTPLIKGDFSADTVRINGALSIATVSAGATTDSVLVWTASTGRVKMRNASAFGGAGDDWGADVVNHDLTLTGDGTAGTPLKVDTSEIATQYDLTLISGGTTDLTIGGAGPSYTIESSTGTDVTIAANAGISLFESPANTLLFNNDGVIAAENSSTGTTHVFDLVDNAASSLGTLTLTEGTGITLTTSGTLSNGIVTIASTVTDTDDQNLTIEGAGPTYQIAINDGTDVTVSNVYGLTLSEPVANTLGLAVDTSKLATQYDISGFGTMSNWLLAASGTGGTETITNSETVTFAETTGLDATRSTNTVSYALSIDEFTTDSAPEGDELGLFYDPSGTNHELVDISELLNVVEEGNVTVQSDNMNLDFQSMFDVAADGAGEVNISLDLSEATTVTTTEADDYFILHDSGLSQHQKILATDVLGEVLTFEEDNANEGAGNIIDFGTGLDLSVTGAEADITLDFNEFATDAATEGDEYVILYDPSAADEEKVLLSSIGGADGNGIYDGDGTTPTDTDVSVTDSLEFNGTLKIINDANDRVGIGAQTPEAKLHIRETSTNVEQMIETTSEKVELQTKSRSDGVQAPFTLSVFNRDLNVDLSGDYYQMGNITFSKASASTGGGSINFNIGYDSTNVDGVLTLKSRESGATDGLVNVAGGLRYKWTSNATSAYTLNTGDFGLTMSNAGTKTVTLPDAVTGIIGQYYSVFNDGAGELTIAVTGGSSDTIYGDNTLLQNESVFVTCVAANKWIINN